MAVTVRKQSHKKPSHGGKKHSKKTSHAKHGGKKASKKTSKKSKKSKKTSKK
jgi:hypothetical protein